MPDRRFRFVACDGCGTEWLDPRPTEEELVAFYPSGYHAYNDDHGVIASALVSLRARLRARQYHALLPASGGRLFDVGAGDCRHFEEMRTRARVLLRGRRAEPGDGAAGARPRLRRRDGEPSSAWTSAAMPAATPSCSMNHVLEHVHDPAEVLRRALTLLEPGGWLVGQIPRRAAGSTGSSAPRGRATTSRGTCRCARATASRISSPGAGSSTCACARRRTSSRRCRCRTRWCAAAGAALRFGRAPWFGGLMLACLPFELLAAACGRSGVIDFTARRRAAPTPVARGMSRAATVEALGPRRSDAQTAALLAAHFAFVFGPAWLAAWAGPGWLTIACWLWVGLFAHGFHLGDARAHPQAPLPRPAVERMGRVPADRAVVPRRLRCVPSPALAHHRRLGTPDDPKYTYRIDPAGTQFLTLALSMLTVIGGARRFSHQVGEQSGGSAGSRTPGARRPQRSSSLSSWRASSPPRARDIRTTGSPRSGPPPSPTGVVFLYGLASLTVWMTTLRGIAEHRRAGSG